MTVPPIVPIIASAGALYYFGGSVPEIARISLVLIVMYVALTNVARVQALIADANKGATKLIAPSRLAGPHGG